MLDDVSSLVAALQSSDPFRQLSAAEKLAQLGEEARPAAVALVAACAGNEVVRDWATSALENLGAPSESDVSALVALLQHDSHDVAYWAATLLGRLGAAASEAVPELAATAQPHRELAVRQRAVWALGKIGAPAAAAVAVLQSAAQDSDPRLANLAREAIAEIDRRRLPNDEARS